MCVLLLCVCVCVCVKYDAVRWVVVVDMSEEVFLQSLGFKKSEKIHKHCCENFHSHYFIFVVIIIIIDFFVVIIVGFVVVISLFEDVA